MIDIENLSKSYGKLSALRNINVRFEKGQCVALIGPNGAGKTTLMKCLLEMVRPDAGSIRFCDEPIGRDISYRRRIGYLPQLSKFPENMRVADLFALMERLRKYEGRPDRRLLLSLGVSDYAKRRLGDLSQGMRQKVSAALAFYFNPEVLLLDEPTASLDPAANEVLKEKITEAVESEKLVLISSHILSDLDEMATHVACLMDGALWLFRSLEALRHDTGEYRLNRIIAQLLDARTGQHA